MRSNKANLFIVGAMRAGTTSFMEVLNGHPEVYFSPIKEPHYFVQSLPKEIYNPSRFFSVEAYFKNDFPMPLHIAKLKTDAQYKQLFSGATTEIYRAEGSTCYLHAHEAAQAIYDYNPEAKIIVLTRSPLARAFSHYRMDKGLGRTTATFEQALQKELSLHQKGELPWYSYLKMSCYLQPINRYSDLFADVLVVPFELLYENKQGWNQVWSFLNIEPLEMEKTPNKNASKEVIAQSIYAKIHGSLFKDYFSRFVGSTLKSKLFNTMTKKQSSGPMLSKKILKQLEVFFQNQEIIN